MARFKPSIILRGGAVGVNVGDIRGTRGKEYRGNQSIIQGLIQKTGEP